MPGYESKRSRPKQRSKSQTQPSAWDLPSAIADMWPSPEAKPKRKPDAMDTATPFLDMAAKAAEFGGSDGISSMLSLLTSSDGGLKKLDEADAAGALGTFATAGEHVSKLLGNDKLADVLGPIGSMLGITGNFLAAADSTKSTEERLLSGGDGAAGSMSLLAKALGVDVVALGGTELTAIASQGAPALIASAGAVLGAGVLGYKIGDGLATLGDSERSRDLNLGGYDQQGNKRTAGDFWADTGVGLNVAGDELGADINRSLDNTGKEWGSWLDDTLGGGGGVVESTLDFAGDGVDTVLDYGGGFVGGTVATGMGAFAGIGDGLAAGGDWLVSSMDQSPMEWAKAHMEAAR